MHIYTTRIIWGKQAMKWMDIYHDKLLFICCRYISQYIIGCRSHNKKMLYLHTVNCLKNCISPLLSAQLLRSSVDPFSRSLPYQEWGVWQLGRRESIFHDCTHSNVRTPFRDINMFLVLAENNSVLSYRLWSEFSPLIIFQLQLIRWGYGTVLYASVILIGYRYFCFIVFYSPSLWMEWAVLS